MKSKIGKTVIDTLRVVTSAGTLAQGLSPLPAKFRKLIDGD